MAHRHYHTEGFILSERPLREKDILVSVFTKDLGLVRASIRSARDIRSKLRPHASRYALVAVTLVRGKEYWKVVGLETKSLYRPIWGNRAKAPPAARLFSLLERLVNGEEPAPDLYADVVMALDLFARVRPAESSELIQNIECVAVLRVLDRLGYLPPAPFIASFAAPAPFDEALVRALSPLRLKAVRAINQAFFEANV